MIDSGYVGGNPIAPLAPQRYMHMPGHNGHLGLVAVCPGNPHYVFLKPYACCPRAEKPRTIARKEGAQKLGCHHGLLRSRRHSHTRQLL